MALVEWWMAAIDAAHEGPGKVQSWAFHLTTQEGRRIEVLMSATITGDVLITTLVELV